MPSKPVKPSSDPLRVVVMNDTSQRSHHGCSRVMRLLVGGLERHGLTVTARSPARNDWQSDPEFLRELERASLVVINGEGTLHHGREAGERLLAVVGHPAAKGCPVAIINALYQANPADWGTALSQCALLSARDEKSAAEMREFAPNVEVRTVPDLSLSAGRETINGTHNKLVFGDSVRWNVRRALALASMRLRADMFLPIKTLKSGILRASWLRAPVYWVYNGVFGYPIPKFVLADTENKYLKTISSASMHVTGRFHSVCLSIVTGTPFLAVSSNSWKIEALLEEAGLDPGRVIQVSKLARCSRDDLKKPFTQAEQANIEKFLDHANQSAEGLFADLACLAVQGRA